MRRNIQSGLAGLAGLVILLGAASLLPGCGQPVYQYHSTPDEEALRPYGKEGNCSVTGQAFLTTPAGDVKYAAGKDVILVPVTPYTREWFDVGVVQGKMVAPLEPLVKNYIRVTTGDGEGRFKFLKVPAGQYYVVSDINWYTGSEYTGGSAYAAVTLADGANEEVIATRK